MLPCNRKFCLVFFFLVLSAFASAYKKSSSEEEWNEKVKQLKKLFNVYQIEESPKGRGTVGAADFNVDLSCAYAAGQNAVSSNPTSVHQLQPQDIDVIAAMGDSITAANGANATSVPGILREFRGMSWSVGGEGDAESSLTLPNILRLFNTQLSGYSMGTRFSDERDWQFNVALPGARARDMPRQAQKLIDSIKADPNVDFENDWKLVTVFIGGNDLCAIERSTDAEPQKYITFLQEGLDLLHSQMKRTLVNMVNILEIYLLPEVGYGYGSTMACRLAQSVECNYVSEATDEELEVIRGINTEYQNLINDLIGSGRYDTRDDFTIVVQPFFTDTVLPRTETGRVDSTYFAPDCFHLSTKGHAMAALNLWNNMMEPVGQKTTTWSISDLKCPTAESPYIFTNLNSNVRKN